MKSRLDIKLEALRCYESMLCTILGHDWLQLSSCQVCRCCHSQRITDPLIIKRVIRSIMKRLPRRE